MERAKLESSILKGVKKVRSAIKGKFWFGSVLSIFFILSAVAVMNSYCYLKPVTPLLRYSLVLL